MAYLSHQETLSLWQRALTRAGLPLRFSEGFNPHPKMSLPLPRSVGLVSQAERLCVQLRQAVGPLEDVCRRLQAILPQGIAITHLAVSPSRCVFYPRRARYRWTLRQPVGQTISRQIARCIAQWQTGQPIEALRSEDPKNCRRVNLRPFLQAVQFDGWAVWIDCSISNAGTARVDELTAWLGLRFEDLAEPVCRAEIQWATLPNVSNESGYEA